MEEQTEVKLEEQVQAVPDKEKPKEKKEKKPSKELTPEQVQKRKKMLVYPIMFLAFVGCMYLIFEPSSKDDEQASGFNAELPMPDDGTIVTDKLTAYEQERSLDVQNERKTLQDFMLDDSKGAEGENKSGTGLTDDKGTSSLFSSTEAHRDMSRQLSDFYKQKETEPEDEQKQLELEWRIQELEKKQETADQEKKATDEQLELMEKSYQMAAKYMGNPSGIPTENPSAMPAPKGEVQKKAESAPVNAVREQEVSGLSIPMDDSTFIEAYSKPRNMGFLTAVGSGYALAKNTIRACIHQDQAIMDGQTVKLRLLEPLQAGEIIIPRNSLVSGVAKIQGERVEVEISTLEYAGNIISVELAVHDSDGMKGIYVPSSMEREALNEAMANIGSGLGSSISFTQSAGQQLTMDVTRGLLQGTSGYLGKKFRTVKVTLKAGYQVMLYAKAK